MKKVNNFQKLKVQPQGVAYKSVAYKKSVLWCLIEGWVGIGGAGGF